MSETRTSVTIRYPGDVLTAAKAQAETEHRTFTDAMVRLARAYGDGDPAALAIVAGVPPAVFEMHATASRTAHASKDAPPAAASSNPAAREPESPHDMAAAVAARTRKAT